MPSPTERLSTAVADRYRIERHLGEGGMATVYLAHDLKHDRRVALKVLRPELAAVIGAERFLAEIRTTANLQHPNILPLFDSGDADGQLFYVMPYVEGESLRDRITREKQLPVDEVVRLGAEVAGALDYAHRQGVVHRDIKPENILLLDGRALVADFGIALALSVGGGNRMTETGMSVGTPAYMSPEQAMGGHDVTGRSDVYALGATLYEALVGEPPFTGPTAQAIIARLVTEDPRPLVVQRKTIPAHVEGAVLTALQRLPADRFATAAELAEALEGRGRVRLPGRGVVAAGTPGGRAVIRISRRSALVAGIALTVAAAAGVWGWVRPRPRLPTTRQVVLLGPTDFPGIVSRGSAIAPDGSAIVYADTAGGGRLFIKERDQLDGRLLVTMKTKSPPGPSFSPDGRWIAFTDGKLEKVARTGGAPVTLSDSAAFQGDVAWLGDGSIVFAGGDGGVLMEVGPDGGAAKRVFAVASSEQIVSAAPVPGADAVLVGIAGSTPREVAVDLRSGTAHPVARGGMGAWIVPGGDIVYSQGGGALLAAAWDRRRLSVRGSPVSVLDGVRTLYGLVDATMGPDGTLLYVQGRTAGAFRFRLVSVSDSGSAAPLESRGVVLPTDGGIDLSPDGTRLALSETDSADNRVDIYVVHLPDGPFTRLTFQGTHNVRPSWSADGRTILYASDAGGKMEIWRRRADGSGRPVRVVAAARPVWEGIASPDGKWIVYRTDNGSAGKGDILAVRTRGDTTPVPLVATEAQETSPALSPDGKWLAYATDASGRFEVFVRPFPDVHDGIWQVSTDGGAEPQWSRDGKELFYRDASGWMVKADVSTKPTFSVESRTRLFDAGAYMSTDYGHYYAVEPGGKRFLLLRSAAFESVGSRDRMVLVRNWLPELRAKLKGQ